MKQTVNGAVYDTANALLIARHETPSGIEALRGQRVFDLYRTPSGSYFKYEITASLFMEDQEPEIIPISQQEARSLFQDFDDQLLTVEDYRV